MKKMRIWGAALSLLFAFAACDEVKPEPEPDPTPVPVIKLGKEEVQLESDGASVKVAYAVENEIEGEKISVDCEDDWLTVDTDKARVITLSATTNETGALRSTEVVFSYKDAEDVVLKVSQDCFISPLTISISGVTATSVVFSVTTSDPELTWIPMVTYKESFEYWETPEELFASDIDYFKYLSDVYDMTLQEFLELMVAKGSMTDIDLGGLQPSTEYVLYAYGITADGRRTTDIVSEGFKTEDPYEGDITFTFEAEEEDYVLNFSIIPSHTGVPYHYGIVTEQVWNAWAAAHNGDMLEAIQVEEIDSDINELMDLGMISGPDDYFALFNEADVMDWGYYELTANTTYVLYAVRWDENCVLSGSVSTYKHKSASVGSSDNVITLDFDTVTQSSARAIVTVTNDDPYVVIDIKSSDIEGMTDKEIFAYVVSKYDYILGEYTFTGDHTRTYQRMRPDTEYTFLAFGYKAGTMTTATMQKASFKTLPAGDPEDCTFEFKVEPDVDNAWVEITPSDKGQFYHWLVYPSYYTADDAKSYIRMYVEDWYGNDYPAFSSWELALGDDAATAWDLLPETEYKVGAVIMDYDTGEFLSDVVFSEPFTTLAKTYADITLNLDYGPYYDLGDLIKAGQTQFAQYLTEGNALMPIKVSTEGKCSAFYYDIYNNDLSDTEKYPDELFYAGLEYGCNRESSVFVVSYDVTMTLVAVAYDYDNNPTMLYRDVMRLTQDGASPVQDFISQIEQKSVKSDARHAVDYVSAIPVATKQRADHRVKASVLEANEDVARAKVDEMRRERRQAEVDAAKMRRVKMIAK